MYDSKSQKSTHPLISKKIIFDIISLSIPFLILGLIELGLRVADYGGTLDLFVPASVPHSNYKKCNPAVGKRYFTKQSTIPIPSNDIFLAEKPADGYRIFVLGGSTALGFPYGNLLMFSRILHKRLEDTFPAKRIEVVNVALTAVNSYTMLDFMDEIIQEDPDAILIYAGHNEYYGALGIASFESVANQRWLKLTYLNLNRLKLFRLMRSLIKKVMTNHKSDANGNEYNPYGTLMERMVTDQQIEYNSALFNKGKMQFESNLRAIYKKAANADIPILISELVSNVHGLEPFVSAPTGNQPEATLVYKEAQRCEKNSKFELANRAYVYAKDLDALRFRAPEHFNGIIHQIASEFNAPVVPMKSVFEQASPHGLVGNQLMVDHLHPNIDGYFLMADAFYNSMQMNHFISDQWNPVNILPSEHYRKTWPITDLDTTIASLMMRQLKGGWPFTPKFTVNRTLIDFEPNSIVESLAIRVISDDIGVDNAHYVLAQHYEKLNDFRKAAIEYDALTYLVFIEAYSYLNRAKAFIRAKNYERAIHLLHESLKNEEIPMALRLVGEIYIIQGEFRNAIPYLEKAMFKNPATPRLLYDLHIAYAKNHQSEKADTIYQKLRTRFPNSQYLRTEQSLFEIIFEY